MKSPTAAALDRARRLARDTVRRNGHPTESITDHLPDVNAASRPSRDSARSKADLSATIGPERPGGIVLTAWQAADLREPIRFAFGNDEEVGGPGASVLPTDLHAAGVAPQPSLVGEPTKAVEPSAGFRFAARASMPAFLARADDPTVHVALDQLVAREAFFAGLGR